MKAFLHTHPSSDTAVFRCDPGLDAPFTDWWQQQGYSRSATPCRTVDACFDSPALQKVDAWKGNG